jgi:hypothetical protein
MNIQAHLGQKRDKLGVALPEYLVKMTHREAIALGAKTFAIGEELHATQFLDKLDAHMSTMQFMANSMNAVLTEQSHD